MNRPDIKTVTTAEQARRLAIDWHFWQAEQSMSYGEAIEWQDYFTGLANKYPELRAEFKENGII